MTSNRKLAVAFWAILVITVAPFHSNISEPLPSRWLPQSSTALAATDTPADTETEETEPYLETAPTDYVPDPLEKWNRAVFTFNDRAYFWVMKPAAQLYGIFIPPGVRTGIRNVYINFFEFPTRFINNTLQGKFKSAGIECVRLFLNTTLGVGGFFEVATQNFKIQPHEEDTGQTLAYYGIKPYMYIVWPFLGPSTLTDSLGLAADGLMNPLFYMPKEIWAGFAIRAGLVMNSLSMRIGEYEDFKKAALDPYASLRQAYLQNRQNEILK